MGLSDFFKKGVEKPAAEPAKPTAPIPPKAQQPLPVPPVATEEKYTIKKGDSLSLIAKHFYGDAMKWNTIFEANKAQIKDPDKIFPGMVITIPKK